MFKGGVRDGGAAPFLADDWNPWEDEQVEYNSALNKRREAFKQQIGKIDKNKPKRHKVQIWGKAAIGKSRCMELSFICHAHFKKKQKKNPSACARCEMTIGLLKRVFMESCLFVF